MTHAVAVAIVAVVALATTTSRPAQQAVANPVPYPEGYRSWSHVKSAVILPGHQFEASFGGIHHVYGNPQGIEGLKSGR